MLTHRNMLLRHRQRHPGAAEPVPRGRHHAALPAAGARVRPADPDRRGAGPRPPPAARRATSRTWSPSCSGSGRPSCSRCPGCSRRSTTPPSRRPHADGKGAIFDRAEQTAIAYSEALDTPGGPGLGLKLKHTLFDRLVYGKLRAALGGRCNDAISGGAPLGARLAHFFRGIGVTIFEGYGLTETVAGRRRQPSRAHIRIGTVGRPLPGVTHPHRRRRRDPDQGRHRLPRVLEQPGGHRRGDRRRRLVPHRRPGRARRRRLPDASPAARRRSSSPPAARTSPPPCWRTGSARTR